MSTITVKRALTPARKLQLRVLAREIADDLFAYGLNERAERLVQMTAAPERPLGGWGLQPATDRIYKHLLQAAEAVSSSTEQTTKNDE